MSIQSAKLFLQGLQFDANFRKDLNKARTFKDFESVLEEYDLSFSKEELEESYNMLLVKCQIAEQADSLNNAVGYYKFMEHSFKLNESTNN